MRFEPKKFSWRLAAEVAEQAKERAEAQSRLATDVARAREWAETQKRLAAEVARTKEWAEAQKRLVADVARAREDCLRSIPGFMALQGIGRALKDMAAFGQVLGDTLRVDLGDWRDTITWPKEIFTDLAAREDFYLGLGFNPALTDFPAPAFEESLQIADLRREPAPLIALYGLPIPTVTGDEEEEDVARINMADKWLTRLEMQARRFIDEQMTKAFGHDWPKHQLPNGLYDRWQEKKRKAQQNRSREEPMIAYADFTDYVLVICRRDNWRIFKRYFGREESVRESFQRLYPIRLDTMHARQITHEDELFLYVETRRLGAAMIDEQ